MERALKRIDLLRHELKALRFLLDRLGSGELSGDELPARDDFQSEQCRELYDVIVNARSRTAAEKQIARLRLEEVDIGSFLRLSGEHYYAYPRLVRQRAAAIRAGKLRVESA